MISVIVPYRDAEKWIQRCADSLKVQTGDFEFIFVNDHSKDKGKEIIKKCAASDSRFVLIDSQHHIGVSGARNTGIENASGEWITFLDVDDEMLPNSYQVFTDELDTNANIHQFNHLRYYADTNKIKTKFVNKPGWYDVVNLPEAWYGVWNKLIRADFLKDIRFDEHLQYGEDGMFVLECLAKDGHIHHAGVTQSAVKHRLENKESLSHIKTAADMVRQADAYEAYMKRQKDKLMKAVVSRELAIIWYKIAKRI